MWVARSWGPALAESNEEDRPLSRSAPVPGHAPAGALAQSFRHEAFVYRGEDAFVDGASSFLRAGFEDGATAIVLVDAHRAKLLRMRLGPLAARVTFGDVALIGRNPARIITALHGFVDGHRGCRIRGIVEPIW